MNNSDQTTALVLCGGGAQGAAEIGFYRALLDRGIQPDFIVGTSVGAINGAFIAAGLGPGELEELWKDIADVKLYGMNMELFWKWGKAASLFQPTGLRKILEARLPADTFEELDVPTTVVATSMQALSSVYLEEGPLVPALMASCAIPVYFPPRSIDGHQLIDGGITNNIPVKKADELGADSIYCLLSDCRSQLSGTVQGLFNTVIRSAQVSQYQKLRRDLKTIDDETDVTLLDLCISTQLTSMLDFSETEAIMEESYEFSKQALEEGYECDFSFD